MTKKSKLREAQKAKSKRATLYTKIIKKTQATAPEKR